MRQCFPPLDFMSDRVSHSCVNLSPLRVAALAPAIAARSELSTLLSPKTENLVARDASSNEYKGYRSSTNLKRDADAAAGAASDTLSKYLAARSLIGRDANTDEDNQNVPCQKLKRDAVAAAVEAASAYEEYARSLEN